jgi:tetratricopeptide (TPR) repeat protein
MTDLEFSKQVTRYIHGELNDEEEDRLWVEFLLDQKRYQQFETELHLYDLIHNKGFDLEDLPEEKENTKRKNFAWITGIAAAVILALSLLVFNLADSGIDTLAVSEIELSEMIGSDVYRDDQADVSVVNHQINSALAAALAGDLSEAYKILNELEMEQLSEEQYQRVAFNKGVLTYNKGNYASSVSYFSDVLNRETIPVYLKESSFWYLANGHLKLKEEEPAADALREVLSLNGQHAEEAGILLNRMEVR